MALRNQPYLPLYVQDFMTDEKLRECSAQSVGVYIFLMCIMHKSEEYGKIILDAKYKKSDDFLDGFACKLAKHLPFDRETILNALVELEKNNVIQINADELMQKRMIRDAELSSVRANAGSKGGKVGRNSGTKRYYNESGFLYLLADKDDSCAFKVGISAEPEKRIKGIIYKTKRENLWIAGKWEVLDMGEMEQVVLDYYDDIRDGEWIFGEYTCTELIQTIQKLIQKQNKSKIKANTEYEYEYDNEVNNDNDNKNKQIADFFETTWAMYPKKTNKGMISDKVKKDRYKMGDEFIRCIGRYKEVLKKEQTAEKYIKAGSTFWNTGYVDFTDKNCKQSYGDLKTAEEKNVIREKVKTEMSKELEEEKNRQQEKYRVGEVVNPKLNKILSEVRK